ncbi:Non-canonical poly(A) RNA polymerase papd5 [Tilletia horrida]|uniref:Non-canonical poly(A) RNA polymerase papd5 n=1 Tax=Tilletia horrida TaxID=155126 RepID=A0AAN6GIX0_9BASI|nr:Non-canonical poly(A) RNA polymerase papd5 [Tilletia horrida]
MEEGSSSQGPHRGPRIRRGVDYYTEYLTLGPPFELGTIDFDEYLRPVDINPDTCDVDLLCMIKNYLQELHKFHQQHHSSYEPISKDARYATAYIYAKRCSKPINKILSGWVDRRTDMSKNPEPMQWALYEDYPDPGPPQLTDEEKRIPVAEAIAASFKVGSWAEGEVETARSKSPAPDALADSALASDAGDDSVPTHASAAQAQASTAPTSSSAAAASSSAAPVSSSAAPASSSAASALPSAAQPSLSTAQPSSAAAQPQSSAAAQPSSAAAQPQSSAGQPSPSPAQPPSAAAQASPSAAPIQASSSALAWASPSVAPVSAVSTHASAAPIQSSAAQPQPSAALARAAPAAAQALPSAAPAAVSAAQASSSAAPALTSAGPTLASAAPAPVSAAQASPSAAPAPPSSALAPPPSAQTSVAQALPSATLAQAPPPAAQPSPSTVSAQSSAAPALPSTASAQSSAAQPSPPEARPQSSAAQPQSSAAPALPSAAQPQSSAAQPSPSAAQPQSSATQPLPPAAPALPSAAQSSSAAAQPPSSSAAQPPSSAAAQPLPAAAQPTATAAQTRPSASAAQAQSSAPAAHAQSSAAQAQPSVPQASLSAAAQASAAPVRAAAAWPSTSLHAQLARRSQSVASPSPPVSSASAWSPSASSPPSSVWSAPSPASTAGKASPLDPRAVGGAVLQASDRIHRRGDTGQSAWSKTASVAESSKAGGKRRRIDDEGSEDPPLKRAKLEYPPWMPTADSTSLVPFDVECDGFIKYMRPSDSERHFVKVIYSLVRGAWEASDKRLEVFLFGSRMTACGTPSSDLDFFVSHELQYKGGAGGNKPALKQELKKLGKVVQHLAEGWVQPITGNVPILKFKTKPHLGSVSVDISFSPNNNGETTTRLVQRICEEYPLVPKLTTLFKSLLSARGIGGTSEQGISRYACCLLCTFFVMRHVDRTQVVRLGDAFLGFLRWIAEMQWGYAGLSLRWPEGQPTELSGTQRVPLRRNGHPGPFFEDPFVPGKNLLEQAHKWPDVVRLARWLWIAVDSHQRDPQPGPLLAKLLTPKFVYDRWNEWKRIEELAESWKKGLSRPINHPFRFYDPPGLMSAEADYVFDEAKRVAEHARAA